MKYLMGVFLLVAGVANASILDGVPDNPDRYISLDLLGTWNHQGGGANVPPQTNFAGSDHQLYHYNDRGMRGILNIPLDGNTTMLIGGNYVTGDYSWDQGQTLIGSNGTVKGFGVEAGLRFYLKP
jgi:hypothetical protein